MDIKETIKDINKTRKANKNQWWSYVTPLFTIKAYNTWIQRINTREFTDSGPSDCSVKEFNSYLTSILKEL